MINDEKLTGASALVQFQSKLFLYRREYGWSRGARRYCRLRIDRKARRRRDESGRGLILGKLEPEIEESGRSGIVDHRTVHSAAEKSGEFFQTHGLSEQGRHGVC